ncbi:MAG: hypothetical protein NT126_13040 [Bacteroidetes bacterium]|nr:hypothetical protein [Bacteroidota bacterium]
MKNLKFSLLYIVIGFSFFSFCLSPALALENLSIAKKEMKTSLSTSQPTSNIIVCVCWPIGRRVRHCIHGIGFRCGGPCGCTNKICNCAFDTGGDVPMERMASGNARIEGNNFIVEFDANSMSEELKTDFASESTGGLEDDLTLKSEITDALNSGEITLVKGEYTINKGENTYTVSFDIK